MPALVWIRLAMFLVVRGTWRGLERQRSEAKRRDESRRGKHECLRHIYDCRRKMNQAMPMTNRSPAPT